MTFGSLEAPFSSGTRFVRYQAVWGWNINDRTVRYYGDIIHCRTNRGDRVIPVMWKHRVSQSLIELSLETGIAHEYVSDLSRISSRIDTQVHCSERVRVYVYAYKCKSMQPVAMEST